MLITITEYTELMEAILTAILNIPDDVSLPVHLTGEHRAGTWMMLPTAICMWVAALLCTAIAKTKPQPTNKDTELAGTSAMTPEI